VGFENTGMFNALKCVLIIFIVIDIVIDELIIYAISIVLSNDGMI
jgi:hypothetical protein